MKYRVDLLAAFLCSTLLATGCGGGGFARAQRVDTLDGWRAFLAEPGTDLEEVGLAQARIEGLAWDKARVAGTLEGYKRYLEEAPHPSHQGDAIRAMADLRFARLSENSGRAALQDYLRRHPEGPHREAVATWLTEVERREALSSAGLKGLGRWLQNHPGAPGSDEVESELDTRRFEVARKKNRSLAVQAYLARFPQGDHREAAEILLAGRSLRAARFEGDDKAAAEILAGAPPAGKEALARVDAEARLNRALRRLDRAQLRALSRISPKEAGGQEAAAALTLKAKQALEALGTGKTGRQHSADARLLNAPDAGIAWSTLAVAMLSPDARRRRVAAKAISFTRSTRAMGPLILLLQDRDLQVAWTAGEGLRRLGDSLDPLVRDVRFTEQLHLIEPRAASPDRQATVALVREATSAGGVLPRLQVAAEGGSQLANLRLIELTDNRRELLAASGRLATHWRARTASRLSRLEGSLRGEGIEVADLRSAHTALWISRRLLEAYHHSLALAGFSLHAPKGLDAPRWVADLEVQVARLESLLPRVEGQLRHRRPDLLADEVDEGATSRQTYAKKAVVVARRLAKLGDLAGPVLAWARRSPHLEVQLASGLDPPDPPGSPRPTEAAGPGRIADPSGFEEPAP